MTSPLRRPRRTRTMSLGISYSFLNFSKSEVLRVEEKTSVIEGPMGGSREVSEAHSGLSRWTTPNSGSSILRDKVSLESKDKGLDDASIWQRVKMTSTKGPKNNKSLMKTNDRKEKSPPTKPRSRRHLWARRKPQSQTKWKPKRTPVPSKMK